jgi:hypothetical protein
MHQIFSKIKQLLGVHAVEYILNKDDLVRGVQNVQEIVFTEQQVLVLNDLNHRIKQTRLALIQRDHPEEQYLKVIVQYIASDKPLFNFYRESCGGVVATIEGQDDLLSFLYEIAVTEYPKLLIKPSLAFRLDKYITNISLAQSQEFSRLIREDSIHTLTDNEDGLAYSIGFVTNDDISHVAQVVSLLDNIIKKAFHNCSQRMSFGFDDYITEIDRFIQMLRELSSGGESVYSSFSGIRGLVFDGFDELVLDNLTVRRFKGVESPNFITQTVAGRIQNGKDLLSTGCVADIQHKHKIIDEVRNYSSDSSQVYFDYQDKIKDAFRLAVIFSTRENRGFKFTFHENGFPLVSVGNYSTTSDNKPNGCIRISKVHLASIEYWYDLLLKSDLKSVKIPLRKIAQAIFERRNHEDALIDAVTAMESIFGAKGETMFKVTVTVARFLANDVEARKAHKKKLKELYDIRSKIVHGNNEAIESRVIEQGMNDLISYVLDCLAKLLENDDLLVMPSHERINHIMLND